MSLSVDNVFVFFMIMAYLAVPLAHQHRALFWGVLGAVSLRLAFIMGGPALIHRFDWMTFVFGGLLLLTAVRLGRRHGRPTPIEANPVLRLVRRVIPISDRYQGTAMLARERGRLVATPLLAAVILLNLIDVVFAVDSIPAVFSVTKDPFVAFTSNALAILGLRSLYFVVAGAVRSFAYLAPALAAVLAFVGTKMLLAPWIHVPAAVSLAITVGILAVGLLVSLVQRSGGFGAVRRRHRADRLSSPTTVTMILVVSALTVAILLIMAFEFVF